MKAIPASIYLFKVKNSKTRAICQICSNLVIKIPEWCTDVVLVSLLLFGIDFTDYSGVSIVEFEQVNTSCDVSVEQNNTETRKLYSSWKTLS